MDDQDRIDRIKTLRQVLADIEAKCGTCPIMSTGFCNEGCLLPAAKVVAETELRDCGEYVHGDRIPDKRDTRL